MGKSISLARNPLTILGGALSVASFVAILFLLLVQFTSSEANPLVSALTYMVLPTLLASGLLLIPVGITVTTRMRRTPEAIKAGTAPTPYPSIDLNDVHHRRMALYFSIGTMVIGGTMALVGYNAFQFMETPNFCGQLCHVVMSPEYTAHERSAHANVACVSCHIGPGASWFVRSKISGLQQVWAVATNTYPQPIEAPIANLRPSRDTCEECHTPERFYGDRLRTWFTYLPDADNTVQKTTQLFRVGSGAGDRGGIHWHTTSKVYYFALDDKRQDIAWVSATKPNGDITIYEAPDKTKDVAEKRTTTNTRLMDCIDCHNRAAHNFSSFNDLVDDALRTGELDVSLPYLKQKAIEAAGQQGQVYSADNVKIVKQRFEDLETFYRANYPQVYKQKQAQIGKNISTLEKLYSQTVFPDMEVGPTTYINELSHEGCFRCHGKLVRSSSDAKNRQIIPDRCDFCHTIPSIETAAKKQ